MEGTKEAAVQSSFLKRQPNKTEYDLVLECLRYIKGIYLALSTPKAMAIQALIAPRHKVKLIKINLDRGLFKYEYKNGTGKANKVLGDLAMKSAKTVETDYFAAMSLKGGAISAVRKEGALIPDAYNSLFRRMIVFDKSGNPLGFIKTDPIDYKSRMEEEWWDVKMGHGFDSDEDEKEKRYGEDYNDNKGKSAVGGQKLYPTITPYKTPTEGWSPVETVTIGSDGKKKYETVYMKNNEISSSSSTSGSVSAVKTKVSGSRYI